MPVHVDRLSLGIGKPEREVVELAERAVKRSQIQSNVGRGRSFRMAPPPQFGV